MFSLAAGLKMSPSVLVVLALDDLFLGVFRPPVFLAGLELWDLDFLDLAGFEENIRNLLSLSLDPSQRPYRIVHIELLHYKGEKKVPNILYHGEKRRGYFQCQEVFYPSAKYNTHTIECCNKNHIKLIKTNKML